MSLAMVSNKYADHVFDDVRGGRLGDINASSGTGIEEGIEIIHAPIFKGSIGVAEDCITAIFHFLRSQAGQRLAGQTLPKCRVCAQAIWPSPVTTGNYGNLERSVWHRYWPAHDVAIRGTTVFYVPEHYIR